MRQGGWSGLTVVHRKPYTHSILKFTLASADTYDGPSHLHHGTCEGRKLLRRLVLGLLRHTRACMDRLSLCLTFRIKARQQESLGQSHATQHCGKFHHSVGRTSSCE